MLSLALSGQSSALVAHNTQAADCYASRFAEMLREQSGITFSRSYGMTFVISQPRTAIVAFFSDRDHRSPKDAVSQAVNVHIFCDHATYEQRAAELFRLAKDDGAEVQWIPWLSGGTE